MNGFDCKVNQLRPPKGASGCSVITSLQRPAIAGL